MRHTGAGQLVLSSAVGHHQTLSRVTGTPLSNVVGLTRELPKEDVLEMALDACKWSIESLLVLFPAYRFILWEP